MDFLKNALNDVLELNLEGGNLLLSLEDVNKRFENNKKKLDQNITESQIYANFLKKYVKNYIPENKIENLVHFIILPALMMLFTVTRPSINMFVKIIVITLLIIHVIVVSVRIFNSENFSNNISI